MFGSECPAACERAVTPLNRILGVWTRPQGPLKRNVFGLDTEFCSTWAFDGWGNAMKELWGKNMRPVDSSTNRAHICFLQISAPELSTFIFELKYIVILKIWEALETVE